MKNPLDYIESKPKRCLALFGISYDALNQLVMEATTAHEQIQTQINEQSPCINAKGGGCPQKLSVREGIGLTLFYLRQAPLTFEVLGLIFEISKTTANTTFHYWQGILRQILPASVLEQAERNDENVDETLKELESHSLTVDSFEQERERPSDHAVQRTYYSGKKKRHTFKTSVIGMPNGEEIIDITVGKRGPEADITLFRVQQKKFLDHQLFRGDKAYIGADNMETPHKKPKHNELSVTQKEENRIVCGKRIFIEHLIRRIRIFSIVRGRFPLHPRAYRQTILTVCGLVRLRLGTLKYSQL
ncbi:MAG: IS5/IS1182 family transposase [Cyanothece sp. SIO2G6]|nr:IS5/IS1182 family transposase [Cyanothece sp. SIO2G6]